MIRALPQTRKRAATADTAAWLFRECRACLQKFAIGQDLQQWIPMLGQLAHWVNLCPILSRLHSFWLFGQASGSTCINHWTQSNRVTSFMVQLSNFTAHMKHTISGGCVKSRTCTTSRLKDSPQEAYLEKDIHLYLETVERIANCTLINLVRRQGAQARIHARNRSRSSFVNICPVLSGWTSLTVLANFWHFMEESAWKSRQEPPQPPSLLLSTF